MKKHVALALTFALSLGISMFSFSAAEASITTKELDGVPRIKVQNPVPVKILADYRKQGYSGLLDLGCLTNLDDAKMYAAMNKRFDGHAAKTLPKANCSAFMKVLPIKGKATVVMGRNMDLPTSNYPAYIFRVNQPGKYKSINIGYSNSGLESFEQIAETSTMDKRMFEHLPYIACDVMNEKGLMLEVDMRSSCHELDCTGTNPGKLRICEINLMRYLGDHCANIAEVLQSLNNVDVYTANCEFTTWHMAFAIADATGRYGVLEFIKNKPVWHEGYPGQTNFWIDKEARKAAPINIGYGRWSKAMQQYNHVKTPEDMQKVMDSIHYSSFFYEDANDVNYDVATEMTELVVAKELAQIRGWIKKYGIKVAKEDLEFMQKLADEQKDTVWTNAWVLDQDNQATVYRVCDIISEAMKQLPASAQKLSGKREMSSISYVANPIEKVYHVRFFETGKKYDFGFDGLKEH